MSYLEGNLISGESIAYKTKLHPIALLPAFFFGSIGLLVTILVANSSGLGVAVVVFVITALVSTPSILTYLFSEFGVTNKRVLLKHGFLRTRSFELMLSKVEGISVDQGLGGKLLGYGTIVIVGTGGSHEPFDMIEDPIAFRRSVQEQVEGRSTQQAGLAKP